MIDFTLDISNFTNFVSKIPNNYSHEKQNVLRRLTVEAQAKAKELAPRATSVLASSIQAEVPSDERGRVYTEVKYAPYLEFGTGIYGPRKTPIVPVRAKYLVFKGKNGQIVRAKSVKGVKAVQYMKRSFDFVKDKSGEFLREAGSQIVTKIKEQT